MEYRPHGTGGPPGCSAAEPDRHHTAAALAEGSLENTRELRTALGCYATGITVVTALGPDGQRAGVTANSFCSVSLDPPLVLWCLAAGAPSAAVFAAASHFAVHILAEEQSQLSVRFSRPARNKFAGLDLGEGLGGAPLIDGVVALFECRRTERHSAGDHVIMLGRVERYRHTRRAPLVFHTGGYRGLKRA